MSANEWQRNNPARVLATNRLWLAAHPGYRAAYRRTPKGRFSDQVQSARKRGIDWQLSFEEWWAIWEPHWEGRGRSGMMMCRKVEPGPYSVDNVYIGTQKQNSADRKRNKGDRY